MSISSGIYSISLFMNALFLAAGTYLLIETTLLIKTLPIYVMNLERTSLISEIPSSNTVNSSISRISFFISMSMYPYGSYLVLVSI